jgi:hypothetical protein
MSRLQALEEDRLVISEQGPFAPATDPNVGYPTTVDPTHYFYLKDLWARFSR